MEQRRAEARWGESAEAAQEAERGHLRDLWLGRARRAPFDGLRGIILAADECQARGRGWEKREERDGGVKSHRGAEYLALAGDSFLPPHHWRTRGSGGGGSDHRPRRRTKAEDGQTSGTRCPARGDAGEHRNARATRPGRGWPGLLDRLKNKTRERRLRGTCLRPPGPGRAHRRRSGGRREACEASPATRRAERSEILDLACCPWT